MIVEQALPPFGWRPVRVVSRKMARSPGTMWTLLSGDDVSPASAPCRLGADGVFRFDSPFEHGSSVLLGEFHASGRLVGSGPRVVLFARVDVIVEPWSSSACELRIVPRSAQMDHWGTRRLLRYYRLAHRAADALVEMLTRESDRRFLDAADRTMVVGN